MSGKFLNLDNSMAQIGAGLKKQNKSAPSRPDAQAVAQAVEPHGFTRSTGEEAGPAAPRRGRPPLNQAMTYWRIYIHEDLRAELNALRDTEGRRLNDLLADMLAAYRKGQDQD